MTTEHRGPSGDRPSSSSAERARLLKLLQEPKWFFSSLREAGAWEWLLPWPLGYVDFVRKWSRSPELTRKVWSESSDRVDDNGWATAAVVIWLLAVVVFGASRDAFSTYAGDTAKLLFSGAFLIGTILSVSVALPGQALAKLTLGARPSYAFHFVVPMVWGFACGIAGALLMMFYKSLGEIAAGVPCLDAVLRGGATFVALYGALMEVNAILHTVRHYLIGMVLWSEQIEKEAREKEREKKEREKESR